MPAVEHETNVVGRHRLDKGQQRFRLEHKFKLFPLAVLGCRFKCQTEANPVRRQHTGHLAQSLAVEFEIILVRQSLTGGQHRRDAPLGSHHRCHLGDIRQQ